MSVNLKLSDVDAKLVADILLLTGKVSKARHVPEAEKPVNIESLLKEMDRVCGSPSMAIRVAELTGYFETAVRANKG